MTLRAEWITDEQRFHALAPSWDELAARDGSPFSLHRWYSTWWAAFGDELSLNVATVWDGDRLVAAAPLCMSGKELQLMVNAHAPLARPVYADDAALEALAVAIADFPGPAFFFHLPSDEPGSRALLDVARRRGRLVAEEPDQSSPVVDLDGTWEEYRGRMKRRWSAAERKSRKMAREHDAAFTLAERPADRDGALTRGFDLEASGWKGRTGTAIASDPRIEAYFRAVAESYDEIGQFVVSEISLDGRCVAYDIALLTDTRLYSLKTAYDEQIGPLSPGLVLRKLMIERCFELGLEMHELLGSNAEWKQRFSTGETPHSKVWSWRRNPAGIARYAYRGLIRPRLRSVYRRLKQLRST